MQARIINTETIETMVMTFYTKVLQDGTVGPFFIEKLGDDMQSETWREHLKILVDFWASIALGDTTYRGNPFAPHTYLGELKRETFEQWLRLFHETLDEVYIPRIADQFKERSSIVAGNFMRNLGIQ